MKKYFTYINKTTSGIVFYVGVGTFYPHKRGYRAKRQRAYGRSGRSSDWHMAASNGFDVDIVFESDNREECHEKEKELIKMYGKFVDGGTLVNVSDGGFSDLKGKTLPPWWRAKISQSVSGKANHMYGKRGQQTPCARYVLNSQNGIFYESVTEAANCYGYNMKSLYNMLCGHRPNRSSLIFA